MPVLSNPKHELFAQELAKGTTAEAAYGVAGYTPSLKNAQRLKSSEGIRSRVEEILSVVAEQAEVTIQDMVRQLDEDRAFARSLSAPSAAVSATMGKAKLLGFLTEKHQVSGPDGGPIEQNVTLHADDSFRSLVDALDLAGRAKAGGAGEPG